jgi:hypothetical protein
MVATTVKMAMRTIKMRKHGTLNNTTITTTQPTRPLLLLLLLLLRLVLLPVTAMK